LDAAYIVEPHQPGEHLTANGLPVFTLYYANDDDGDRRLGSDSKLTFTAPADGSYLVRVSDVRGHASRSVRLSLDGPPAATDFSVTLAGNNPTINAGSGKEFTITADRRDGFDGEIRVSLTGALPPGFCGFQSTGDSSRPQIGGRRDLGHGRCTAAQQGQQDNAAQSTLTATADIGGHAVSKPVGSLGTITLAPKPKLTVRLLPEGNQSSPAPGQPPELTITAGSTTPAILKIERNGFDGLVSLDVNNLPHGVIVDNIGLNAVLIPAGESERQIFLNCAKFVPETDRLVHAWSKPRVNQASPPLLLHVKRAAGVAGGK